MQKETKLVHRKGSIGLPQDVADYLKAWMMSPEHINHPYPTEQEKEKIMADTGMELKQLTNWFVNNRRRYWRPRVKALHAEPQSSQSDRQRADRISHTGPVLCSLEGTASCL